MSPSTGTGSAILDAAKREADAYRGDNPRPLGGYVMVLLVYVGLVAAVTAAAASTGRRLPEGWKTADLLTLTLGTHKLSRTLAKDAVTSPLRVPFARYVGSGGPAELMEETRNSSALRHSLGELLTCPFCLDMWVVATFTAGLVLAPRSTRLVAGTFSALAGADFLQLAYVKAQQMTQQ